MKIVQTQPTNLLSDKTNFQNKILTKGQNNHTKQQIRRRKNSYWDIYICTQRFTQRNTQDFQTDKTDKWRDGPIDGKTCGWTDRKRQTNRETSRQNTSKADIHRLHSCGNKSCKIFDVNFFLNKNFCVGNNIGNKTSQKER